MPEPNIAKLLHIAERQEGVFSSRQALECGFSYQLQHHHIRKENWVKCAPAVFRLNAFPQTHRSDSILWSIWSCDSRGHPQAAISHASALSCHGIADSEPVAVHLTVPAGFRKRKPEGVCLHKATLTLSEIQSHGAFMATTPFRTLTDMRDELAHSGAWDGIVKTAGELGLLSETEWRVLSGEDIATPISDGMNGRVVALNDRDGAEMFTNAKSHPGELHGELAREKREQARKVFAVISNGGRGMNEENAGKRPRNSVQAFTLVELLVVIAIISVLAGMLLPVLENALDSAHQMKCMNQVKQFGNACAMYVNDNSGYLPVSLGHPAGQIYDYQLSPYVEYDWYDWNKGHYGIWHCPSAWFNTDLGDPYRARGYALNEVIGQAEDGGKTTRPDQFGIPSAIVVMGESFVGENWIGSWGETEYIVGASWSNGGVKLKPTRDTFHFRHQERMNILFADGHVSSCLKIYSGVIPVPEGTKWGNPDCWPIYK
jgi:prepilin-type processing-associated H-X9-DG protein/prepilin-type N-terminal cleavage/methylation domain-containing protein